MLGEVVVLGKLEEALQVPHFFGKRSNDHRLIDYRLGIQIGRLTEYLITVN